MVIAALAQLAQRFLMTSHKDLVYKSLCCSLGGNKSVRRLGSPNKSAKQLSQSYPRHEPVVKGR